MLSHGGGAALVGPRGWLLGGAQPSGGASQGDGPLFHPPGHAAVGAARGVGGFLGCNCWWLVSSFSSTRTSSPCVFMHIITAVLVFLINIKLLAIIRCALAEARCVNNQKIASL